MLNLFIDKCPLGLAPSIHPVGFIQGPSGSETHIYLFTYFFLCVCSLIFSYFLSGCVLLFVAYLKIPIKTIKKIKKKHIFMKNYQMSNFSYGLGPKRQEASVT